MFTQVTTPDGDILLDQLDVTRAAWLSQETCSNRWFASGNASCVTKTSKSHDTRSVVGVSCLQTRALLKGC